MIIPAVAGSLQRPDPPPVHSHGSHADARTHNLKGHILLSASSTAPAAADPTAAKEPVDRQPMPAESAPPTPGPHLPFCNFNCTLPSLSTSEFWTISLPTTLLDSESTYLRVKS